MTQPLTREEALRQIAELQRHIDSLQPTITRRFWRPEEIPGGWQIRLIKGKDHYGLIQYGEHGRVYLTTSRMIDTDNFTRYEVAPPGPTNQVQWQPAGVEE